VTYATVFERTERETLLHPRDGTCLSNLEVITAPVHLVTGVNYLKDALDRLQPGQYALFEMNQPTIDLYARSAPVVSTQQHKLTLDVGSQFKSYADKISVVATQISAALTAKGVPDRAVHLFVTPQKFKMQQSHVEQMQAMQLPRGHYFAAVSAERSSCENLLWAYSCIIKFKSAAAKDAAPTDVGKAKRKVEEKTGAT